jgi:hypothetical protein
MSRVRRLNYTSTRAPKQGASALHGVRTAAAKGSERVAAAIHELAPRIAVRDVATMSAAHGGLMGEDLADALVRRATLATASVGVAGGAIAVSRKIVPGLGFMSWPASLALEALAITLIEVRLVAELHEVYGVPVRGNGTARGTQYLTIWAGRRGVDPLDPRSYSGLASSGVARAMTRRMAGRVGPMATGAVAGAAVNRHQTSRMADELRAYLRAKQSDANARPPRWLRALPSRA